MTFDFQTFDFKTFNMTPGFNYIIIVPKHEKPTDIAKMSLLPACRLKCADGRIAIAGHFYDDEIKYYDHIVINSRWMGKLTKEHQGIVHAYPELLPRAKACDDCEHFSAKDQCCRDQRIFIDAFTRYRVCRFHLNAIALSASKTKTR